MTILAEKVNSEVILCILFPFFDKKKTVLGNKTVERRTFVFRRLYLKEAVRTS